MSFVASHGIRGAAYLNRRDEAHLAKRPHFPFMSETVGLRFVLADSGPPRPGVRVEIVVTGVEAEPDAPEAHRLV